MIFEGFLETNVSVTQDISSMCSHINNEEQKSDTIHHRITANTRLKKSQKKVIARDYRKFKLRSQRTQERKRKRELISSQRKLMLNSMTENDRKHFILRERFLQEHKALFLSNKIINQTLQDYKYCPDKNYNICFNLSFERIMNEKELNSLVRQISLSYYYMIRSLRIFDITNPELDAMTEIFKLGPNSETSKLYYDRFDWFGWINFHISPLKNSDTLYQIAMEKYSMNKWKMILHEKPFWDIFPKDNIVILSPDANEELQNFEPNKVYIVGGLVDRTVTKYESLNQGIEKDLVCKKLPIKSFIGEKANCILNVNTVIEILVNYIHKNNWKEALVKSIPTRRAENQGRKALKRLEIRQSQKKRNILLQ
ncbi:tRNA -methyltransferase family protein [Cryptosporidium serpentis]